MLFKITSGMATADRVFHIIRPLVSRVPVPQGPHRPEQPTLRAHTSISQELGSSLHSGACGMRDRKEWLGAQAFDQDSKYCRQILPQTD
jgi:hypothetical protein